LSRDFLPYKRSVKFPSLVVFVSLSYTQRNSLRMWN
jgi:hypothetical protein